MLQPTSYGYAHHDAVDDAITVRVNKTGVRDALAVGQLLGEALAVIAEINQSIPVQSPYRHLVAPALEKFANG